MDKKALIVREGASLRTGDELVALFIMDVDVLIYPNGGRSAEELENILYAEQVEGWLSDNENLIDIMREWEDKLYSNGYSVIWDDGYRIQKEDL